MHQIRSVSTYSFATRLILAYNPSELFKAQVAARIGREPHEILLKRQGERPFKDQLTLEDYGVSNGVQLDLSVIPPKDSTLRNTNNTLGKSILAIEHHAYDIPEPSFVLERPCFDGRELGTGGLITMIPRTFPHLEIDLDDCYQCSFDMLSKSLPYTQSPCWPGFIWG